MKLYIKSAEVHDSMNKNVAYNQKQTETGSKLKTYKGSPIQRSTKYGVGKEIGGDIYVHKNYVKQVVPTVILEASVAALKSKYPDFSYNCIRYSPKTQAVSFQEAPDFDTAREPIVGDYITVMYDETKDPEDFVLKKGHSNYIFHSKWLWVKNDYTGFDVSDAWRGSKKWLSTLKETSDGNGIARWNAQLDVYNLPHDRKA